MVGSPLKASFALSAKRFFENEPLETSKLLPEREFTRILQFLCGAATKRMYIPSNIRNTSNFAAN